MRLLTEDMKRVVREQRLGFVATVCPDGAPNLSPKGTMTVWDDEHLVLADIRSPGTLSKIQHGSAVEINAVDPMVRKGHRFKGPATIFTNGPLFEQIVSFDRERGVANAIRAAVLVKVERASPLISPVYDLGLTEEAVRRRWVQYWDCLNTNRQATMKIPDV